MEIDLSRKWRPREHELVDRANPSRGMRDVFSRGGPDVLSKGGTDVLSKGGLDIFSEPGMNTSKKRRQTIEEIEQYYGDLELSKRTGWDRFIRHLWSRWLAEYAEAASRLSGERDMSQILDQQYSAQQCALNLLSLYRELEEKEHQDKPAQPLRTEPSSTKVTD